MRPNLDGWLTPWSKRVGRVPFFLGCLAAYLFGYRQSRQRAGALLVASLACLIAASALLVFAYEGLVCLLMAAPLAIPLALAGGYLGWALAELRHTASASEAPALSMTVLLSLGLLLEGRGTLVEPVREVLTAVEIGAPPETVWEHVVEFPPLSDPEELLFRAGIAWPASATIEGTGAGAIRRCVFSTGAFVEPISVWDAPHVLRFDVTENPPPLSELNPFGHVDAPHLHGTFQAVEGEFRLIHLPGGRTRLEGRTWYRNAMTPRWYWGAWSDAVVHRIHARVLDHVRALSESEPF
jgi:hypothetical protein